jgi:hypothetical protein
MNRRGRHRYLVAFAAMIAITVALIAATYENWEMSVLGVVAFMLVLKLR